MECFVLVSLAKNSSATFSHFSSFQFFSFLAFSSFFSSTRWLLVEKSKNVKAICKNSTFNGLFQFSRVSPRNNFFLAQFSDYLFTRHLKGKLLLFYFTGVFTIFFLASWVFLINCTYFKLLNYFKIVLKLLPIFSSFTWKKMEEKEILRILMDFGRNEWALMSWNWVNFQEIIEKEFSFSYCIQNT